MSAYRIRPHHALCIQFFEGKGYSEEFTENMTRLIGELEKNALVEIVCGSDVLCKKCPHCKDNGCESGEKTERYDRAVMELCGFCEGEILSAGEFLKAAEEKIIFAGKLEQVCSECAWSYICFKKLQK
ncbi:MAG: DUF1284 domain-containing protein [Oscillospiraceae bacterium]